MPSLTALPPASLDALHDLIVKREIPLRGRAAQVLRFAIENPLDIALGTTVSISQKCQVSVATVVRLVTRLGFHSFAEFRELFRKACRETASRSHLGHLSQ